jgi:hypothetical protein
MPRFTTRVELHGASEDDYKRLHAAMEARGFSRQIESTDGTSYWLPTAEYNRSGPNLTVVSVRDDAEAAAKTIRPKYAVLVTESKGRRWAGLKEV